MTFLIWLVAGGLLGWVVGLVMQNEAQRGVLPNVAVGVVGAALGGLLIAPLFGATSINQNDFSATGLMASLLGAVALLAILSLVRRGGAG